MRLVMRKIWRAFPELDRFDDEQCERFVNAANHNQNLRIVRGLIAGTSAVAVGLGPIWLMWGESLLSGGSGAPRPIAGWFGGLWAREPIWACVGVYLSFWLVGALAAGWTRDLLLEQRVRSVMVSHGACKACSYFLGGLPVDPQFRITCPECGVRVRVDASLVELAPSGGGVFTPSNNNLDGS